MVELFAVSEEARKWLNACLHPDTRCTHGRGWRLWKDEANQLGHALNADGLYCGRDWEIIE